jgi:cytochrome b561
MSDSKYTKTAIILHWLIALGIIAMFVLGWYMEDLPKNTDGRAFFFNLHKSVGVTLFALIVFRIYWRLTHRPPALLASMRAWEKKLASFGHKALYVMMFAVPLSGLIMSRYSKYGVKWFGFPFVPGFDDKVMRENFLEVHQIAGIILLVIIAVHLLATIKHKFIDKDETLKRMSLH